MKQLTAPSVRSWIALVMLAGTCCIAWMAILPRIAQWPPVRDHLQRMDDRNIDASAMFYTELEKRPD